MIIKTDFFSKVTKIPKLYPESLCCFQLLLRKARIFIEFKKNINELHRYGLSDEAILTLNVIMRRQRKFWETN